MNWGNSRARMGDGFSHRLVEHEKVKEYGVLLLLSRVCYAGPAASQNAETMRSTAGIDL